MISPMVALPGAPLSLACSGCTVTTGPSGRGHLGVAGVWGYLANDTDPSRITTPPPEGVTGAELPLLSCFGFPRRGCVVHVGGEVGLDDLAGYFVRQCVVGWT